MFKIGQKVVCVDPVDDLVLNRIYTVMDIHTLAGAVFINVDQVSSQNRNWSFYEYRFRPVVERKTDISVFTAMLNPSQVTVDAMKMADFAREIVG